MTFHFSAVLFEGYVGIVLTLKKKKESHIFFCSSSTFFSNFSNLSKYLATVYEELELFIHISIQSKKIMECGVLPATYNLYTRYPMACEWMTLGIPFLWADQWCSVEYPCGSTVVSTKMAFLVAELSFSCVMDASSENEIIWVIRMSRECSCGEGTHETNSLMILPSTLYSRRKIMESRIWLQTPIVSNARVKSDLVFSRIMS